MEKTTLLARRRQAIAANQNGATNLSRSHALRGNAVLDAPRPSASPTTQSVEDGIPTGTVGTSTGCFAVVFGAECRKTASNRGHLKDSVVDGRG